MLEFEKEIFSRCKFDLNQLVKYGFQKENETYIYTKKFLENQFEAIITISREGKVKGDVQDVETKESYPLLRNEKVQGSFIGQVREEYQNILMDIATHCTTKSLFFFEQTSRMTQFLWKKYQDKPEFLWEDLPGCCIFRNKKTNKWYGIIMNVDYSKLSKNRSGIVEIINVKVKGEDVPSLLQKEGIYPAYHMNKKYWISIVLDDTIKDKEVYELLDESYYLVEKR